MVLENKLGITSAPELAEAEEKIKENHYPTNTQCSKKVSQHHTDLRPRFLLCGKRCHTQKKTHPTENTVHSIPC